MDLGLMSMKSYFTLLRTPEVQPHHQMQFCVIPLNSRYIAQSAGAVEYTDSFSLEGIDPLPNKCPVYDTKQSDGEFPAMLDL